MSDDRAFKGIWIPAEIWLSEELTWHEKIIYSEINSLDGEDHCFASNEYLAKFCKVSESAVSKAIAKLIRLGYIENVSFDGRQRILAVTGRVVNYATQGSKSCYSDSQNINHYIYSNSNTENNRKAQAGPASVEVSSKRNFRRNKEVLSDDLASAKDIVSQTKKQKEKAPIDVQCLDEIERDSYGFDKETKQMLAQYIQFVTATGDSRRVKDLKLWRKKLTSLLELSHNDNIVMRKIIKQSLDNKWYKFVEYEEHTTQSRTNVPTVDNLIHQSQRGEDIIAQRIARGIKAY